MKNPLEWLAEHEQTRLAVYLVALLAALFYLLTLPDALDTLRYQRADFPAKLWQSVSHALVHLNLRHLSLNVLALLCMVALFGEAFRTSTWLLALFASAAVSATGMFYFSPLTDWCVGLSGALHGLMVYAVLRAHASPLWLLALVAKLGVEQTAFYQQSNVLSATTTYIGHDVVVDAHLWGAIGGLLIYLLIHAIQYVRVSIEIIRARS